MTDQPKPDRQNGDGYYGCSLPAGGCECPQSSRYKCSHAHWIATRPARDAAEGAERRMVAEIPFDPTNHHNALKCPYCNPEGLTFAPPKPAPDAPGHTDLMVTPESLDAFMDKNPLPEPDVMREALEPFHNETERGWDHLFTYLEKASEGFSRKWIARLASLQAALSAPVPPADGAIEIGRGRFRGTVAGMDCGDHEPVVIYRTAGGGLTVRTVEDFENRARDALLQSDSESAPSGTGAAEPDFKTAALALGFRVREQDGKWWHPNQQHFVKHHDTAGDIFDWYFGKGWGEGAAEPVARTPFRFVQVAFTQFKEPELRKIVDAISKQFATPPVRGREAIAQIVRFTLGHRLIQNISGNAEGGPVKEREVATVIDDAILSLHAQPGAGERNLLCAKIKEACPAGQRCSCADGNWQWFGGACETAICGAVIKILSRQAPHSSSEAK